MDDLFLIAAVSAIWSRGFAIIFGVMCILGVAWLVGVSAGSNATFDEAQKRGFAEYCSTDGKRVWIGECAPQEGE